MKRNNICNGSIGLLSIGRSRPTPSCDKKSVDGRDRLLILEQFARVHAQGGGDLADVADSHVDLSVLDLADEGLMLPPSTARADCDSPAALRSRRTFFAGFNRSYQQLNSHLPRESRGKKNPSRLPALS